MDDGRPQGNITVDGNKLEEYEGMKLPSIVDSYEKYNGINSTLVGTRQLANIQRTSLQEQRLRSLLYLMPMLQAQALTQAEQYSRSPT